MWSSVSCHLICILKPHVKSFQSWSSSPTSELLVAKKSLRSTLNNWEDCGSRHLLHLLTYLFRCGISHGFRPGLCLWGHRSGLFRLTWFRAVLLILLFKTIDIGSLLPYSRWTEAFCQSLSRIHEIYRYNFSFLPEMKITTISRVGGSCIFYLLALIARLIYYKGNYILLNSITSKYTVPIPGHCNCHKRGWWKGWGARNCHLRELGWEEELCIKPCN